jgi:hypothetical protein
MSNPEIGSHTSGAGADDVSGNFGFYSATPPPAAAMPFLTDTLSVSEVSTERSNNMADPTNPRLQKPTYAELVMQFQLGMAQITTEMLTQWNKSIQDEAQRVKEELNSPAYQSWLEQHSSKYIAELDVKAGKDLTTPTKDATDLQAAITTSSIETKDHYYSGLADRYYQLTGLSNLLSTTVQNMENTRSSLSNQENGTINLTRGPSGPDLGGYEPGLAMAASLAIGMGFISNYSQVPDVASTSQVEVKTIQDAWNNINAANDQITQTGGWFSALWGVGLIYQLSAQNISELGAGHEKGPHRQLEFAKDYAQKLLNSLEGDAFNNQMLALLTPMLEKTAETTGRQSPEQIALKGKIILLALALALVYKLELKSVNPEAQIDEGAFAAMLGGKVDFSRNDTFETAELKRQLVAYFQYNLNQLPDAEKIRIVEGILAYVSKTSTKEDRGVEGLLDQQAAFEDILIDGSFERSLIGKKPIDA